MVSVREDVFAVLSRWVLDPGYEGDPAIADRVARLVRLDPPDRVSLGGVGGGARVSGRAGGGGGRLTV